MVTTSLITASSQSGPSTTSGFSFGLSTLGTNASMPVGGAGFAGMSSNAASTTASTVTTSATAALGFGLSSVAPTPAAAPAAGGFSFTTTTAPTATTTQTPGLNTSQLASSTSAPAGFYFGTLGNVGASTGVSFGGQTSTPVTTVASSQFGTVTTASAAPAFNFGAGTSTGENTQVLFLSYVLRQSEISCQIYLAVSKPVSKTSIEKLTL